MAGVGMEDILFALDWVLCIYYPVWFKKDKVRALINFGNKVNTITPAYALKLSLKVRSTDIGAQKTNVSTLKMFEIILTSFQVEDK